MKTNIAVFVFLCLTVLFSGANANAQWVSGTNCAAYTDCYARDAYGRLYVTHQISCQTYGSSVAYGPSYTSQACQWLVIPGAAVSCSGYAQIITPAGAVWGWQDYRYSCY